MPTLKRTKTRYPGVYYVIGSSATRKPERIYYIRYRKDGKEVEEKAGRQFQDDMTPARAAQIRGERIRGSQLTNKARREAVRTQREAEANRWTFRRVWAEYMARNPGVKRIDIDEVRWRNYLEPAFGHKEPHKVSQFEVDALRVKLLKKLKPQTVKHILSLLVRLSRFAVKKQLCPGLGFTVEMPRVNNQKTEDLTPTQLAKLLEAIEKDSCYQAGALMKMALFTGMRRREMFRLRWEDVDFDRGFIHIRDPKGGPDQIIPLNEMARGLLENHPHDSEYVFPGRYGRQRTDVTHQVRRIADSAGLSKDFRPLHGLRHTFASMLASSGKVDMYALQKALTHKSPQMTQRYAHLRDAALRRVAIVADDLITQAMNGKEETEKEEAQVVNLDDHKQ
ncbi:MAG: tyrosine-type recombinase/integrase [Candidatus Hodarchaeota archaeon]